MLIALMIPILWNVPSVLVGSSNADWVKGTLLVIAFIATCALYRSISRDRALAGIEVAPDGVTAVLKSGVRQRFELRDLVRIRVAEYGRKHGPTLRFRRTGADLVIKPHEFIDEASLTQALDDVIPVVGKVQDQLVPTKLSELRKPPLPLQLARFFSVIALAAASAVLATRFPGPFRKIPDLYWRFLAFFVLLTVPLGIVSQLRGKDQQAPPAKEKKAQPAP
jgi:hypothetical protein